MQKKGETTLIDIFLLAQVVWLWLWVRTKASERALLYVAAVCTSMFAATHLSPWFTRRFMETGSTFEWLVDRMQLATHPVGLSAAVVPAIPTSTNFYSQSQWVALHVFQGVLTVLMAWAIFMLFVVMEYLVKAFWDEVDDAPHLLRDKVIANVSGLTCGVVFAGSTLWFLANLSWLTTLQKVAGLLGESTFSMLATMLLHSLLSLRAMV